MPDGWWQRTLALDPTHWLRLSGSKETSRWNAFRAILMQSDRPPLPLPVLFATLFLTHSTQPDTLEHRHVFGWVTSAIPELYARIPLDSLCVGWDELTPDEVDHLIPVVIDILLDYNYAVPWSVQDGLWVQVFDRLANFLWRLPPEFIREIVAVASTQIEQVAIKDQESGIMERPANNLSGWLVLGYFAAIRFWRDSWPNVRNLRIQTSMRDVPQLWQQALVIMHPDAPLIADTDLIWLCDSTVGAPYDGPFDSLCAARLHTARLDFSPSGWQERIARLEQDAAQGRYQPSGCWNMLVAAHWPVLSGNNIATMRVVAGPEGCWVRLIPANPSWGSVLWWRPQMYPPSCWSFAFGEALTSIHILALHETLWYLWRNLRVCGRPENGSAVENL
jgi:hypothetical protein